MAYCSNVGCARFAWGSPCPECDDSYCHVCDRDAAAHSCRAQALSPKATARKFVLITGANRGIGFALAEQVLRQSPENSVLLATRTREKGQAARNSLIEKNPDWATRLAVVELDVVNEKSIKEAVEQVSELLGGWPLYAVVNNAGTAQNDPWETVKVNTIGVHDVSTAFAHLIGSGGRVVTISSCNACSFLETSGKAFAPVLSRPDITWDEIMELLKNCIDNQAVDLQDVPWAKAYGLSKAAVNAFNVWFAREHPRLLVSACNPGFTDTDMTRPLVELEQKSSSELGMQSPEKATLAPLRCLFEVLEDTGGFYNSEGTRSALDKYCCQCCLPPA